MQHPIDEKRYHIEILTPKQDSEKLDQDLERFEMKYRKVLDAGYIACITDNPMGMLSFQATEMFAELDLPTPTDQVLVHLNTFHTRDALDEILETALNQGLKNLLIVSGDGNERLPKLTGESLGVDVQTVTSVTLLHYIHKAYPGAFATGVAFNPYEPPDHEFEKMQRKIEAGASFVITQPVIGYDENVAKLESYGLPVIIDAWMSKKLHLLSECVGYTILEDTPYDPMENLRALHRNYPNCGFYLALLGFKTQYPLLSEIWN